MGDGQNLNYKFFLTVNYRERKALQDEFSRAVLASRPAPRRSRNQVDCSIEFCREVKRRALVALPIPIDRSN